jgi:hypothetical protein
MQQFLRTPALTLALCAAPLVLHAQGMPRQAAAPVAVDASAPAAVRAHEVVTVILSGDLAAVEAFVRQNADPNLAGHPQLSSVLADLVNTTRDGAREIVGYTTMGNGIYGVELASTAGGRSERTIMIVMHEEAPYKLRRVGMRRPAPAQ